jgi:rhodanese-related sulfurtransferase
MKKFSLLLFFLIAVSTVSVSCQNNDSDLTNITVQQLKEAMKTDSNLVILDVRTPEELTGELGQIPGVINIPVQVLDQRISELEKYKNKDIAVICRSGNRSSYATKILQEKGFKAKNVLGGMKAYNKL